MSDEMATKLKVLSDSLANNTNRTLKKKEDNEALAKTVSALEKDLTELRVKSAMAVEEKLRRDATLQRSIEDAKKKIELAKRILNSDKNVLTIEKEALNVRYEALQADCKRDQTDKGDLLKHKQTERAAAPKEEETKHEEPEETLDSLTKNIKVEKEKNGFLTVPALTGIMEACTTLAAVKFRDTVYEKRTKLREREDIDLKAFMDQAGDEVTKNTKFLDELMLQVLNELKLEKSLVDKSVEYYVSIGNFEVMALMNLFSEKFKSFLRGQKAISLEEFKDILKFKAEYVEREGPAFFSEDARRQTVQTHLASETGNFTQKEQMSLSLLKNFFEYKISEAIHKKFGVEEEDIREAAMNPEIQYDMDIASFMIQNEEAMYKIIPQLAPGPQGIGHAQNY